MHFSRNYFFGCQKPVFPLFLGDFKSDRAENFFGDTSTNLWGIFFFCRYLLSIKFGRIRKIFEILKCLTFSEILSILVLLPEVLGIFQKKKYTPRLSTSTYSKNFSSNEWNLWNCKGENFRPVFGPCGLWKSMKMRSGKFVSRTTFALLLEAYLPWKFQKFSLSRFLETPERGEGSP